MEALTIREDLEGFEETSEELEEEELLTLDEIFGTSQDDEGEDSESDPLIDFHAYFADVGETVDYTITVTNTGAVSALGVEVSDTKLPSLSCTPTQPADVRSPDRVIEQVDDGLSICDRIIRWTQDGVHTVSEIEGYLAH